MCTFQECKIFTQNDYANTDRLTIADKHSSHSNTSVDALAIVYSIFSLIGAFSL